MQYIPIENIYALRSLYMRSSESDLSIPQYINIIVTNRWLNIYLELKLIFIRSQFPFHRNKRLFLIASVICLLF